MTRHVRAHVVDPAGPAAATIADLWWLMLVLGAVVFAGVAALLVVSLVGPRGSAAADPDRLSRRWVAGGGVVLPVVVLVVVFGATLRAMVALPTASAGALTVEIIGHQWWYEVRYPDHGVETTDELRLPVGRPVALRLTSADVIHSVWIPALGGKMDMLPDGTNTLVLQADRAGEFHAQCAEFCGLHHTRMALRVVAQPPADFAAWLAANG